MGHIVIYEREAGTRDFRECEDLQDAVRFVEDLRNDEGVDSASIYELQGVNYELRPYYRVELDESTPIDLRVAPVAEPFVAEESLAVAGGWNELPKARGLFGR